MWSDGRRGSIIPIPSQQQPSTRLSERANERASAVPEMDGANVRDLPPSKTLGGGGGGGDIHRQQTDFLGIFFARRSGRPQFLCVPVRLRGEGGGGGGDGLLSPAAAHANRQFCWQ